MFTHKFQSQPVITSVMTGHLMTGSNQSQLVWLQSPNFGVIQWPVTVMVFLQIWEKNWTGLTFKHYLYPTYPVEMVSYVIITHTIFLYAHRGEEKWPRCQCQSQTSCTISLSAKEGHTVPQIPTFVSFHQISIACPPSLDAVIFFSRSPFNKWLGTVTF